MLLRNALEVCINLYFIYVTLHYKMKLFQMSQKFPELLKNGNDSNLVNHRPISVSTCFSKIFEKIMYKGLFKHLSDNNIR